MISEHASLSVAFDEPDAGWIRLDVGAGEQRFSDTFSHVYPSLKDLCSALCDVVNGVPSRPAVFLLGAPEIELRISPEANDGTRLVIRLFPDRRRDRAGEAVLETKASARSVVMTFWRALRRLQTSLPGSEFEARFREPFPDLEMASLTRLIDERWRAADGS